MQPAELQRVMPALPAGAPGVLTQVAARAVTLPLKATVFMALAVLVEPAV
jgi:hypothetical protein